MSTRPAPVALTACMLHRRNIRRNVLTLSDEYVADLASRLHRLAKGCERASVAECNGEMRDGQRSAIHNHGFPIAATIEKLQTVDDEVAAYCARIDKQVAKLSAELAPFGITCKRNGDPRGFPLKLYGEGIPHNDMGGDCWGISA